MMLASTPEEPAQDFSRHSFTLDRETAWVEGSGPSAQFVPLSFHPSLHLPKRLRAAERRQLEIKQTALRVAAGLEPRSLRTLARHIGCSHTAIEKAVQHICDKIGLRRTRISNATSAKLRAARQRPTVTV